MLIRAGICFLSANGILLVWDFLRATRWRETGVPLGLSGVLLGALLVYRTASVVGAFALAQLLQPRLSEDPFLTSLALAVPAFFGLWIGGLALQVERKILLRLLRQKSPPLELFRPFHKP